MVINNLFRSLFLQIQVDPYLEDALCSNCSLRQGPYFCREMSCFKYYCRSCWDSERKYHHLSAVCLQKFVCNTMYFFFPSQMLWKQWGITNQLCETVETIRLLPEPPIIPIIIIMVVILNNTQPLTKKLVKLHYYPKFLLLIPVALKIISKKKLKTCFTC